MTTLDIGVLVLYFVGVAGVGWWSSRHSRDDSRAYFLGGGSIGWIPIGASLFASNISSEHFIGLAGTGAASGIAVGQYEWLACFMLMILAWLFVPFYLKTGVFTMPEFLERRYNSACRTYLSVISILAYIATKVSVCLYAGAMVMETVLGWNIWVSAVVLVIATGVYTVFGGLRAVIFTDYLQAVILILGGFVLTGVAFGKVGGFDAVVQSVPEGYFNLWKPPSDASFPWTGVIFGAPLVGIWYWCTDQMIVQRTLAADSVDHARKAAIFAGFLKILPVFILVFPGIAGRALYPDVEPDKMYATLVNELLGPGMKGLVIAALLSALMSSLSSTFNSSSTLVTMDFYRRWNPEASERQLVRAGQITTVILVVVGIAWIPFIGTMSNQLYVYLQSVQAYISPPIACVFLLGLLWKRCNAPGALATLITGFVVGAIRFVVEVMLKKGLVASTGSPEAQGAWIVNDSLVYFATINFAHFSVILAVLSLVVIVSVSLMTKAPDARQLEIFTTVKAHAGEPAVATFSTKLLSLLLVFIVFGLWIYFSPIFFPDPALNP